MPRAALGILLSFGLALFGAATAAAQAQPPAKRPPQKAKKVWTNDDLEELSARVPRSEFGAAAGPGSAAAAETKAGGEAKPGETQAYAKDKDPAYYKQRAAALRAELDRIDSEIRRLRSFKSNPSSGTGGLALGQDNLSLTPENQIRQLEVRRSQVEKELDDLEAEARRNGFPPGTVR